MEIRDYPRNLELLVNTHIQKFLEVGSKEILINKARSLKSTIQKSDNWRFSISPEHPLTFKKNNLNLQVDFSCEIEGVGNDFKKHNIQLRIWCLDENICYRAGLDHPKIKEDLETCEWKRVILRFHFDLKAEGAQIEPLYHLHVGGKNRMDDEFCWFPENIDVPRFPYQPTDIILLSEFVLMNFFQEDYKKIRKKPEWISLVRKSQELFQKSYFEKCLEYLDDGRDTLMGNLVTHTGGL